MNIVVLVLYSAVARPSKPRTSSKTNIEEFVPEGVGVDDFLSDDEEEDEDDEEDEEDR